MLGRHAVRNVDSVNIAVSHNFVDESCVDSVLRCLDEARKRSGKS